MARGGDGEQAFLWRREALEDAYCLVPGGRVSNSSWLSSAGMVMEPTLARYSASSAWARPGSGP